MLRLDNIHPQWLPIVKTALDTVDPDYIKRLEQSVWLPGEPDIFNAFSLALDKTSTILLGESPYPRQQSANGYAFWDASVDCLWSDKGLAKSVNRATSLRNFMKMLLCAEGRLITDFSQPAIAQIDKQGFISTATELFQNMMQCGILLLNASLVLSDKPVSYDAKAWQPFVKSVLRQLSEKKPSVRLLLFGKIAQRVAPWCPSTLDRITAEHPYNLSFITNPKVIDFFKPLNLLHAQ